MPDLPTQSIRLFDADHHLRWFRSIYRWSECLVRSIEELQASRPDVMHDFPDYLPYAEPLLRDQYKRHVDDTTCRVVAGFCSPYSVSNGETNPYFQTVWVFKGGEMVYLECYFRPPQLDDVPWRLRDVMSIRGAFVPNWRCRHIRPRFHLEQPSLHAPWFREARMFLRQAQLKRFLPVIRLVNRDGLGWVWRPSNQHFRLRIPLGRWCALQPSVQERGSIQAFLSVSTYSHDTERLTYRPNDLDDTPRWGWEMWDRFEGGWDRSSPDFPSLVRYLLTRS